MSSQALNDNWAAFDNDASGDISRDEFKAGLQKMGLGLKPHQAMALFSIIDHDHSGTITKEELRRFGRASGAQQP